MKDILNKSRTCILMATYNGERFIREQIDSIISQTVVNWILLIHDDGSTDKTLNIVKEFQKKDLRIKIIEDRKIFHNSSANFIHLLNYVSDDFDYICFCDQDDIWDNKKLSKSIIEINQIEVTNQGPICIATDLSLMDKNNNVFEISFWNYSKMNKKSTFNTLMLENTATGCTMMMNREILSYTKKIKKDDFEKIIQHDWFIALICASDGVYKQIQDKLVYYRQHEYNVVGARKIKIIEKFKNRTFFTSLKKIQKLQVRIYSQLILLTSFINNNKNIEYIKQFTSANFLSRKIMLVNKKMLSTDNIKQSIINFLLK